MPRIASRPAEDADWTAIEALLAEGTLPVAGAREHLATYWVAVDETGIVGVAGAERYGPDALLRSVAVRSDRRTKGIGQALVGVVTAASADAGVETLYLLTTTAAAYFETRGFIVIDRTTVPDKVRSSAEFSGACPASAVCMRRRIA